MFYKQYNNPILDWRRRKLIFLHDSLFEVILVIFRNRLVSPEHGQAAPAELQKMQIQHNDYNNAIEHNCLHTWFQLMVMETYRHTDNTDCRRNSDERICEMLLCKQEPERRTLRFTKHRRPLLKKDVPNKANGNIYNGVGERK